MKLDLHTHSAYSEDAKPNAAVPAVCRAAAQRGLDILALTDHKDFFFTRPPQPLDMERRARELDACRWNYAGRLEILTGVELGEIHAGPDAAAFATAYDLDLVIGSLHVYRKTDTDFYFLPYASMNREAVLREYFTDLLAMVRCGGFDTLGHIDYPLRVMQLPGTRPTFRGFENYLEPILRELINREIALEINAASLFCWRRQAGPEPFVLDMYRSLGGRMLTIGSDSHCAADVGRGIPACIASARRAGFTELTVFRKRRPYAVSIEEEP